MLTVGSLFSGIGGFDLGLERAGMRTLWLCEQDPYCQRVLARHWPGVPCHPDVCVLVADTADGIRRAHAGGVAGLQTARQGTPRSGPVRERNGSAGPRRPPASDPTGGDWRALPVPVPPVDVLAGGFPCQDLSYAGRGAGINGARSGLWTEFARLIRELRPRYVLVENVPALLARGMGRVLADLAACGYDAEWDCIPASAVGAPHRRDRVWIVAYPRRVGDTDRTPADAYAAQGASRQAASERGCRAPDMADPDTERRDGRPRQLGPRRRREPADPGRWLAEPGLGGALDGVSSWLDGSWEHGIPRTATGVANRVDRLRALGNALVPQIAELIGRRIIEWERTR